MQRYLASMEGAVLSGKLTSQVIVRRHESGELSQRVFKQVDSKEVHEPCPTS